MTKKEYEKIIRLIIENPDLSLEEISFISNTPRHIVEDLILGILEHCESEENTYLN